MPLETSIKNRDADQLIGSEYIAARAEDVYLFTPSSRELLIGRVATSGAGVIEYEIVNDDELGAFSEVVTSPSVVIPVRKYPRERFARWELEDYRIYGKWLFGLDEIRNKDISHHIVLNRSYKLGAGPSRDRIIDPARFGSVANFCRESDIVPNVRYGKYDSFTFDDYVAHIRSVIAGEETYKINQVMLWQRIKDGHDEPSPAVIRAKTKDRGGLTAVLKAAGVRSKVQMSDEELVSVWLEYMVENGGQEPTVSQINEKSKQGRSHHHSKIIGRFGDLRTFRLELRKAYDKLELASEKELSMQAAGQEIKQALESGELPIDLFKGVSSGAEMISRYKRFLIVSTLLPNVEESLKIRTSIPPRRLREIVKIIEEQDPSLSKQLITAVVKKFSRSDDQVGAFII